MLVRSSINSPDSHSECLHGTSGNKTTPFYKRPLSRWWKDLPDENFIRMQTRQGQIYPTSLESTNLYASLWFWTKDAAEPRWLHRPLQRWFAMILKPKEFVFHDLLLLIIPSPSRNGRKRPCLEKGMNLLFPQFNLNDCENSWNSAICQSNAW